MRLKAKARPVQITKLRLAGIDINTKDELLQNFCVSEIIDLGSKFTQWLDRHDEVKEYANHVSSIFNENKNKEKQASALLTLFFPEHTGQNLIKVLYEWKEKGKNNNVLLSLLNSINPNPQLAIELMQNDKLVKDKVWLNLWLKSCSSKIYLSSDFCFAYGVFLKAIDQNESENWLQKAAEMGNEKTKEEIQKIQEEKELYSIQKKESHSSININIKGQIIHMVKVSHGDESFYITTNPISGKLLKNLNVVKVNKAYDDYSPMPVSAEVCKSCITLLNYYTSYRWQCPTEDQWSVAYALGKIHLINSQIGEWCKRDGQYTSKCSWIDSPNYFRPILEISKNPSLK